MTDRPTLFSAEMVRAILDGRKTQTRRVLKPQPTKPVYQLVNDGRSAVYKSFGNFSRRQSDIRIKCPYGQPGDTLWVRETWGAVWPADEPVPLRQCEIEYRADLPPGCTDRPGEWPADEGNGPEVPKWRPSIHMPRWASRITLRITDIRVERLQDISEDDAKAEGAKPLDYAAHHVAAGCGARIAFEQVWTTINGPNAWGDNPWVWVVAFERVKP
jgi:hypothetical protein